MALRILLNFEI